MSDKVNIKKVTTDNCDAVVELDLGAVQEDLVAGTSIRLPRCSVEVELDHDGEVIAVLKL